MKVTEKEFQIYLEDSRTNAAVYHKQGITPFWGYAFEMIRLLLLFAHKFLFDGVKIRQVRVVDILLLYKLARCLYAIIKDIITVYRGEQPEHLKRYMEKTKVI